MCDTEVIKNRCFQVPEMILFINEHALNSVGFFLLSIQVSTYMTAFSAMTSDE